MFIKRFLNKLPQRKVFIIPNKMGVIFIALNFVIILISLIYSNNSILLIGILLFIFLILHAFQTNNNLEAMDPVSVNFDETLLNNDLELVFREKIERFNLLVQINLGDDIYIDKQIEKIDSNKINKFSIKLNQLERGFYKISRLKLCTTYPFGLFYSWLYFDFEPLSVYVYPKLIEESGMENIGFQYIDNDNSPSTLSSDQKYKEHLKYAEGSSVKKIDWKKYAKSQELYVKVFESSQVKLKYFKIDEGISEKNISKVAYLIDQACKNGDHWNYESKRVKLDNLSGKEGLIQCLKDLTLI